MSDLDVRPGDVWPPPYPPRNERGYISGLRPVNGLRLALKLCRDVASGSGLAQTAKRIPEDHTARACPVGKGPEYWVVRCVCGSTELVSGGPQECSGGCHRWFASDESSVWAFRIGEQE